MIYNAKKGKCSSNKGRTELSTYMLAFSSPITNFCNTYWNVNLLVFLLSHSSLYRDVTFIWEPLESTKDDVDRRWLLLLSSLFGSKAISNRDILVIPTFSEGKMYSHLPNYSILNTGPKLISFIYLVHCYKDRHSKHLLSSFSLKIPEDF